MISLAMMGTLPVYNFIGCSTFYVMVNISLLAFIENLTIQMIIPEMRSDIKGLYWVLKERKK